MFYALHNVGVKITSAELGLQFAPTQDNIQ